MKKYICVKEWARNKVGDVVEEYQYKRYPEELRSRCFKLIEVKLPETTVETIPEAEINAEPIRVESEVELSVTVDAQVDTDALGDFDKKFRKKPLH